MEKSEKVMLLTCLKTVMQKRKLLTDTETHANITLDSHKVLLICISLPVSISFHCLFIYVLLQFYVSFLVTCILAMNIGLY